MRSRPSGTTCPRPASARNGHAARDSERCGAAPRVLKSRARVARTRVPGALLESVEPFDVYSGPPVPEGSRSVAVRLSFRAPGRTLTDAEVDAAMSDVMAAVRRAGLEVRE